jgi:gamma-glutamyltranspeptidase/glutathione hydrolase
MSQAVAAPRLHTEGNTNLEFETAWPAAELAALASMGYKVKTGPCATLSAVSFDPKTGESRAAMR